MHSTARPQDTAQSTARLPARGTPAHCGLHKLPAPLPVRMCAPPPRLPAPPACTSAWKVSAPSTLANHTLSALISTVSGSFEVIDRMESRSVRGTPDSCSITSILQDAREWGRVEGVFEQNEVRSPPTHTSTPPQSITEPLCVGSC